MRALELAYARGEGVLPTRSVDRVRIVVDVYPGDSPTIIEASDCSERRAPYPEYERSAGVGHKPVVGHSLEGEGCLVLDFVVVELSQVADAHGSQATARPSRRLRGTRPDALHDWPCRVGTSRRPTPHARLRRGWSSRAVPMFERMISDLSVAAASPSAFATASHALLYGSLEERLVVFLARIWCEAIGIATTNEVDSRHQAGQPGGARDQVVTDAQRRTGPRRPNHGGNRCEHPQDRTQPSYPIHGRRDKVLPVSTELVRSFDHAVHVPVLVRSVRERGGDLCVCPDLAPIAHGRQEIAEQERHDRQREGKSDPFRHIRTLAVASPLLERRGCITIPMKTQKALLRLTRMKAGADE